MPVYTKYKDGIEYLVHLEYLPNLLSKAEFCIVRADADNQFLNDGSFQKIDFAPSEKEQIEMIWDNFLEITRKIEPAHYPAISLQKCTPSG